MTIPGAPALTEIEAIEAEALTALERARTSEEAEAARVQFLGRKGRLTALLRRVGSLPPAARRDVGARGNAARERIEAALAAWADRETTRRREGLGAARIDVTLPGRPVTLGRLHPLTQVIRQICGIFVELGFSIVEGPEVEWDYYNFEALNIPADHPARDMWDTFWIEPPAASGKPMLLRTHTSPMQIRILEQGPPPVRVVVPGKCYRYEAIDASHESQFHQIEGLAVDTGVTFADLKGTLHHFARRMFGAERRVRFRCDYFPFVEPGVDMSIDCFACQGRGCRLCKESGWLEILGAGMVHPEVLARVGVDPARYTGFAFGMGPARVAMLKHGIEDIRLFHGNDPRFLRQFP